MNNVTTQGQAHQETGRPVGEWSDEQLRVRVAELCGWKSRLVPPTIDGPENPYGEFQHTWWTNPAGKEPAKLPDYPNDLNAMAEAEKLLLAGDETYNLQTEIPPSLRYGRELTKLTNRTNPFHATARQRAVAFIQTLSPVSSDSTPNGISASIPNTGQKDQP